ncbi:MAG: hypothetical protein O2923_01760 [Verrucomicrobia bacterium]|nr:hypothetical protein [Verrucomicrobiota bacterium]MDA1085657.1 hypothetical protein [Verrucomicrobiota bacterium]
MAEPAEPTAMVPVQPAILVEALVEEPEKGAPGPVVAPSDKKEKDPKPPGSAVRMDSYRQGD